MSITDRLDIMPTRLSAWTGLGAIILWVAAIHPLAIGLQAKAWLLVAMVALATIPVECITLRRTGRGMFLPHRQARDMRRVAVKWLGGGVTFAGIALCYYLFPEYDDGLYAPFFATLAWAGPAYAAAGLFSIWYFDPRLERPEDVYHALGRMVLTGRRPPDLRALKQHVLQWLVKGFFLPLMFVYAVDQAGAHLGFGGDFRALYGTLYALVFVIDLGFTVTGYLMASRFFDSHIRSADPTAAGWVSALVCYHPFWSFVSASYLVYWYPPVWGDWLWDYPLLYGIWGSAILACSAVYAWATMVFGSRFSNLTHRGIITFGPYAILKHPAYTAKLTTFLLIQVPWAAETTEHVVKGLALWAVLASIYYVRAKTEERHLRGVDPTYAHYEAGLAARRRRWRAALAGLAGRGAAAR